MSYDEKEDFFKLYFQFIVDDMKWMLNKYPNNEELIDAVEWCNANYDTALSNFMLDDFIFSIGFVIYTAKKN